MDTLKTHSRVVGALIVREIATRFGGKPGGYVWAILEPAAYIGMMTVIFSAIAHLPSLGTSFILFFATGYLSFTFYQGTVGFLSSAVRANKALLSYPNVAPIDTILARLILQTLTTTMVCVIVFVGITSTTHFQPNIQWGYILESVTALLILALGMSFGNAVLFPKYPLYEQVYQIVTRPLMLVSGVMYLPDGMPHPYGDILLWNPLCHATMLFRQGFYQEYRAMGADMGYMWSFTIIAFMIGYLLFTLGTRTLRAD